MKKRGVFRVFYDWMGVLLAICLVVLGLTGAWRPGGKSETPPAAAEEAPSTEQAATSDEYTVSIEQVTDPAESDSADVSADVSVDESADESAVDITVEGVPAEDVSAAQIDAAIAAMLETGKSPVIVVDAGHGGVDNGASSPNGVPEAGINLTMARLVESGLKEAGFQVILTRTDEKALGKDKRRDMDARREIMRGEDVEAIVSIHMNKFRDATISGPMAFYMKGSEEGAKLATHVIENVCLAIGNPRRDSNPGDYFVLRESIAPAVIVECGFLSNAADEKLLQDAAHQKKLAKGIVAGISAYFAQRTTPLATPTAKP